MVYAISKLLLLKSSLTAAEQELFDLQLEISNGIIDPVTAEEKVRLLKKEIIEKKKKIIAEAHIGKHGKPLSMGKYNVEKKLFIVRCVDGTKLYSKTEEGLLDALMSHYGLSLDSPLVKDVFERAIEKYAKKHPGKSKTVYNMKIDYKRFISKELGLMDIRKISADWLEEYILNKIISESLKVTALKNMKTLLNLIYEKAISETIIHENIAKAIKTSVLTAYCDQSLAHRKPEDLLFSDVDQKKILDDMWKKTESGYHPYAYAVLLHSELGCRPDELICLKWSDISFNENLISIERQQVEERNPKQTFRVVEYTKNEKGVSKGGRPVPLSSMALKILDALMKRKEELGIKSEWLFSDKDGELLKKKGYFEFNNVLHKKYQTKASGSYTFRRGMSARMEAAGIEPSERAAILGHSVETNLKNYTFAKPDYLDRVRKALG